MLLTADFPQYAEGVLYASRTILTGQIYTLTGSDRLLTRGEPIPTK
jgi:hypothetical protein